MGTMMMYYNLAMAAENDEIQATLNKVDRFLSITACAWPNFMARLSDDKKVALNKSFKNPPKPYTFGEGADDAQPGQHLLSSPPDLHTR